MSISARIPSVLLCHSYSPPTPSPHSQDTLRAPVHYISTTDTRGTAFTGQDITITGYTEGIRLLYRHQRHTFTGQGNTITDTLRASVHYIGSTNTRGPHSQDKAPQSQDTLRASVHYIGSTNTRGTTFSGQGTTITGHTEAISALYRHQRHIHRTGQHIHETH